MMQAHNLPWFVGNWKSSVDDDVGRGKSDGMVNDDRIEHTDHVLS